MSVSDFLRNLSVPSFFLALSNIQLLGRTTVYLSIHLLKDILLFPSFGSYE